MNPEMYNYVPLNVLKTPKTGMEVIAASWWLVDPSKGAMFYKRGRSELGAPQCNRDKKVTEIVCGDRTNLKITFIDVAYIPMRDYSHNIG